MYKIKLSPYHKIFYNEWKIAPDSSGYNIVFDQTLSNDLDTSQLQKALSRFITDYVLFNSHVTIISDEAYWIKNTIVNQLEHFSTTITPKKQIQDYVNKPFNLENEPLYRFAAFRCPEDNYRVVLVFHHLLLDGYSFDNIIAEISKYYNDSAYKAAISTNTQTNSIVTTTENLYKKLEEQGSQSKIFWESKLSEIEPISLRFIKNLTNVESGKTHIIKESRFSFSDDVLSKLKLLKNKYQITPYRFGQIIFAVLFNKYTSQNKFAISYPITIKEHQGLMFGAGINTNLIPYYIDKNTSILDLVTQLTTFIHSTRSESFNHGYYPVYDIPMVNKANLDVVFMDTNLKDTLFSFNNLKMIKVNCEFNVDLHCKLSFEQETNDQTLNYRVKYDANSIDEVVLQQFINHYKKLFFEVLSDLNQGISNKLTTEYPILDAIEYQQIIYDWNDTEKSYARNKTIHQLFEEQVEKTPHNIALIYEKTKLTYNELNAKSNQLANYLRKAYKIQGDDLVALCLDRNENMLIAILAVLKAGAAYVPIDSSYPDGRISYILLETKAKLILANAIYQDKLNNIIKGADPQDLSCTIHSIDKIESKLMLEQSSSMNLTQNITSKNLAYVIYTSGTTGVPKGVMVEHMQVVLFIQGFKDKLSTKNAEQKDTLNMLSTTNYVFDVFGLEYILPLSNGSSVTLDNLTVQNKSHGIKLSKYDYIQLTPSKIELLLSQVISERTNTLHHLTLLIGGEVLTGNHLKLIYDYEVKNNNLKIDVVNVYGPTEATIWSTMSFIEHHSDIINIGKPLPNQTAYVLNSNLYPLPVGAIGELYIGGAGLARGYLNQPELTSGRFIDNPFQSKAEKKQNKNERLYKTGDLVRYLPGGNLEYIGRNDFQVKIRGYRIELDEIENALNTYPEIKSSIVLAKEYLGENSALAEHMYLIAYYVADMVLDEKLIIAHLAKALPNYMIPNIIIRIEKLPLTLNGKVDKDSLPAPSFAAKTAYVAPRNELETKICNEFTKVLQLDDSSVGIHDDFFQLGGNSILAIKLANKINNVFHSSVKVIDVFTHKTIESIANLVKSTLGKFAYEKYLIKDSDTVNLYQAFDLNNVQQAYYFGRLGEFELGNISTHIYSELIFNELDPLKLEEAINVLIRRHLGLRTIFVNGQQQYLERVPTYKIVSHEFSDEKELLSIRNELSHKIYKADQFPLFDFIVSKYNNSYILHISFDALLMDGNSYQILFNELGILYNNSKTSLPPLNVTYRDYITQFTQIRQSSLFSEAEEYWLNKLENYSFAMNLPLQCQVSQVVKPVFNRISRVIDKKIWHKIESKAKLHGISNTSLILNVYGKVLSYWTNQDKLCVNLTLFNRLPLHAQINDIIGDFTALELFNYHYNPKHNILAELQCTHQELWNDIEHNLFDGIDFQRLIRKELLLLNNQIIAPVVLTSMLGNNTIFSSNNLINDSYQGVNYSITQTSQLWLDNKAYETKNGFVAEWDYVEQLFERSTIEAMHKHYCCLLEYLAEANWNDIYPPLKLPRLDLTLISQANLASQSPVSDTLFGFYENYIKSKRLLKNIAVIDNVNVDISCEYSYAKLINESEQLAKHILQENVGNNQPQLIAILSEKGYNQVIASLAIMKSGCGYLPLNVGWPIGRIEEVLVESGATTVLISKNQASIIKANKQLSDKYRFFIIEDILAILAKNTNLQNELGKISLPQVNPDDTAYVIFTSGSTGKPKGVTISHRGALNTILAVNDKFKVTGKDKVLALSELSFDLSVYDIFGLLTVGGTIVFPNQDHIKESINWVKLIDKYSITIWNTVPQLASLLIDNIDANKNTLKSLRLFLLSGDWISTSLPGSILQTCPMTKIVSLGGATEGSIWSIWYEITNIDKTLTKIPYGVAMPNQKMYVLSNNLEYVPIGVIGEIYIGGIGVALNYWNNNVATKKSFISHPELGKIYKTGDLGKWHKAGYIEFMGRLDNQVKLNGYRIELGEIENKIVNYLGIKPVVVIIKENPNKNIINNKYIVAYYVSKKNIDEESLLDYLATQLPGYMIPYALIHLNKLPLSKNGKLDYDALPEIDFISTAYKYVAPKNALEKQICEIYAEILGLTVDEIGITDDFFRLGGNSILAIKLANKLSRNLNLNVAVATLFKYKTIASILEQAKGNKTKSIIIPKAPISSNSCYQLSFAQERLWFIEEYERGSNAYNIPLVAEINNEIDLSILKQSISSVVARHEVLYSLIKTDDSGNGYQVVGNLTETPLIFNEYTVPTDVELTTLINQAINHVYKLNEEYPIRVSIFSKSVAKHRQLKYFISIVVHHIAFDGWSIDIFLDELKTYYNYYCEQTLGKTSSLINLPELSIQYKDFAIWQRGYLSSNVLKQQLLYWLNKLNGYETLNIPLDKPRPPQISYSGNDVPFILTEITSNKLRKLAKSLNVSLYSVLLSGYYILLSSYSKQDDIIVGAPVTNRNCAQLENLVGLFLNNLALRTKITKDDSLVSCIKATSEQIIEAQLYQDLPFEKLVTELNIPKDTSRHPIFQVMFTMQNFGNSIIHKSQLFKPYHSNEYKIARFDITTFIDDSQAKLCGIFNYATTLFNQETILHLIKTYQHILEQLAELNLNNQVRINDLSYLTLDDYKKVIYTWNKTTKNYPENKTIHELFEEQAARTPNNVAVIYENVELTYQELNARSNQLASFLRESYQIQADDLIALCLDRSEYMLIAILAVLKSGGAYVPIDPNYPDNRINYIFIDTNAKVILTNEKYNNKLITIMAAIKSKSSSVNCDICLVDNTNFQITCKLLPINNLKQNITNANLAYVIYTSGTTGVPNGVMIEHRQVSTFILGFIDTLKHLNITQFKILSTTNYVFDIFGLEYGVPLLNGDFIEIASSNFMDQQNTIKTSKYNLIQLTPSKIEPLLSKVEYENNDDIHTVVLLIGGEVLSKIDVEHIRNYEIKTGNIFKILNLYGPTETTIWSTMSLVESGDIIRIGKPLSNETTYVLDDNLNPLPIGAIGELYIGGNGLSRMYLNQVKLTKTRFVLNPYQSAEDKLQDKNARLYKTGDLVRYSFDGNLEYIGRTDFQVKIRGFRIELGEIESIMDHYPDVQQSVVVVNELKDSNKCLIAYYVSKNKLDEEALSIYLAAQLPEYMLPTTFIHLDKIPLTVNGKLDRQALPLILSVNHNDYIAPHNIAELKVCTIYSEILNLPTEQIGINHDFFKLGGNSILAINLLYKLQQEFKINLNDIFKFKTPARIAKWAPFTKNSLYHKLIQIKSVYDRLSSYKKENNPEVKRKKMIYLQQVKQIKFTNQLKNIHNVLLTGATGHLGCHLLYQLLLETNYTIYLLVRAESDVVAYDRVNNKYKFYFDSGLDEYRNRIVAIAADIEKSNLNLSKNQYKNLVSNVDSVIHAAALVKHYGDSKTFYQANVQTTINMLELVKLTTIKDFHYISTLSVLTNGYVPNYHYYIFTEYDNNITLKNSNNVYTQTKYESELITINARAFGINSNIYRVGNLSMNSKNFRNQENLEENAFFARVKTILEIGMIPNEISQVEVSPVDCTALAIVKLFNQTNLNNQTFHVANPHICDLSKLFTHCKNVDIKVVALEEFIDAILTRLNNTTHREQIERFMLHQMWLENVNLNQLTQISVLQDKTDRVLNNFDFSWPAITSNMIASLINQSISGDKQMKKKEPIFEYLESIAELIPAPFYWLDVNGKCLGLNTLSRQSVGATTKEEVMNKTAYEFYQNVAIASEIQQEIDKVLKSGIPSIQEDKVIDIATGKFKYFSSTRAPLKNKKGEIIGIVGTAIETTSEKEAEELKLENQRLELENKTRLIEKEAEHLKLENEANKAALAQKEAEALRFQNEALQAAAQEQEKFRKIVKQMMHDITSPIVSIENIVGKLSSNVPEDDRVTLNHAAMAINGISQNLLSQYNNEHLESEDEDLLASLGLLQIVNEKREQHHKNNVVIDVDIEKESKFTFIKHNPGMFKRMISNLVNNAADALKNRTDGKVTITLGETPSKLVIFVDDNGPGMPQHIIDKFNKGIEVTEGKENGHGIGLTQVRDTITSGNGTYKIKASPSGTNITISFPKIATPNWLTTEIKLTKDDTVIILDDDPSIHGSWEKSFKDVLEKNPTLKTKHFFKGKEAVAYINALTSEQKQNTFLLTDFELLKQGINGLKVIKQTNMHRAILVTSYSSGRDKQTAVMKAGIKMLPKELASSAVISVDKKIPKWSKKVDIVWVEDLAWFLDDMVKSHYSHLKVDKYHDPISFMEDIHQYPLDTKIILDTYYEYAPKKFHKQTGYDLAAELHALGYTKLILFTGEDRKKFTPPEYLTIVYKTDLEARSKMDKI